MLDKLPVAALWCIPGIICGFEMNSMEHLGGTHRWWYISNRPNKARSLAFQAFIAGYICPFLPEAESREGKFMTESWNSEQAHPCPLCALSRPSLNGLHPHSPKSPCFEEMHIHRWKMPALDYDGNLVQTIPCNSIETYIKFMEVLALESSMRIAQSATVPWFFTQSDLHAQKKKHVVSPLRPQVWLQTQQCATHCVLN